MWGKRKKAKAKGKREINYLKARVAELERQIQLWWGWWQEQWQRLEFQGELAQSSSHGGLQADLLLGDLAHALLHGGLEAKIAPRPSVQSSRRPIEYSRWNHRTCSSAGSQNDEDDDGDEAKPNDTCSQDGGDYEDNDYEREDAIYEWIGEAEEETGKTKKNKNGRRRTSSWRRGDETAAFGAKIAGVTETQIEREAAG